MLKEAIILAGGFGTRLRDVVVNVPKPMAPVCDKPFLDYLLKYVKYYGVEKVVLSVGYLSEKIIKQYGTAFEGLQISYSIEKEPMGTGGGIRLAMEKCIGKDVLVLNGDSFFDIHLNSLYDSHCNSQANCTLALRKVENASRYGTVVLGKGKEISGFKEKDGQEKPGTINAGVYILNRESFLKKNPPAKNFSIEKDFFETKLNELKIFGFELEGYFIDIGIPEDYKRAQHDFKEFNY